MRFTDMALHSRDAVTVSAAVATRSRADCSSMEDRRWPYQPKHSPSLEIVLMFEIYCLIAFWKLFITIIHCHSTFPRVLFENKQHQFLPKNDESRCCIDYEIFFTPLRKLVVFYTNSSARSFFKLGYTHAYMWHSLVDYCGTTCTKVKP